LCVRGGARSPEDAIKPRHRHRWPSDLYMDGPSLINFTVGAVPQLVENILKVADTARDTIDLYLMHQATLKMLDQLRERLGLTEAQMPVVLREMGNTVSSTLPILIDRLRQEGKLRQGMRSMLVGFGVGWSWSGCIWDESWSNSP